MNLSNNSRSNHEQQDQQEESSTTTTTPFPPNPSVAARQQRQAKFSQLVHALARQPPKYRTRNVHHRLLLLVDWPGCLGREALERHEDVEEELLTELRVLGQVLRNNRSVTSIRLWLPTRWDKADLGSTATAMNDFCVFLSTNPSLQKVTFESLPDRNVDWNVLGRFVESLVSRNNNNNNNFSNNTLCRPLHICLTRLYYSSSNSDHSNQVSPSSSKDAASRMRAAALSNTRIKSCVMTDCDMKSTLLILQGLDGNATLESLKLSVPASRGTEKEHQDLHNVIVSLTTSMHNLRLLQMSRITSFQDGVQVIARILQAVGSRRDDVPLLMTLGKRPEHVHATLHCLWYPPRLPPPIPFDFVGIVVQRNIDNAGIHVFWWNCQMDQTTALVNDYLQNDASVSRLRLSFTELHESSLQRISHLLGHSHTTLRSLHVSTRATALWPACLQAILPHTKLESLRLTGFEWNVVTLETFLETIGRCPTLRTLSLEGQRWSVELVKRLLHYLPRLTHIRRIVFPWLPNRRSEPNTTEDEHEQNHQALGQEFLDTVRTCRHLHHVQVCGLPGPYWNTVRLIVHRHRLGALVRHPAKTPPALWPLVLEQSSQQPSTLLATLQVLMGKMDLGNG